MIQRPLCPTIKFEQFNHGCFVPNCENISVLSLLCNREKFSAQTTGLLFRNNHKMPRKKMKTATFFQKSDTKVNGSNVFTHCLRDVKSEVLMSSHFVIIAPSMLLRRLCVQAFPILLWGPTKRSSAQLLFQRHPQPLGSNFSNKTTACALSRYSCLF